MLGEDEDEEDEAEASLGHGSHAQIQAIMQTHSLAALGHEDAAPGLVALAGDRRGAKSPHAHLCYPAWALSMGFSQALTPGGTFSPEQGGRWSFMEQSAPTWASSERLLLSCSHQVFPRIESHPALSEYLQGQIPSPLQAPTAVFENTHCGLVIHPCVHGEFPLLQLLLLPLTVSLHL